VHNQLEPLLLNFLEPLGPQGREVTAEIIGFVDNVRVGVLGALGIGFLFITTLSLIQKVEWAFNYIWYIERARTLTQQFSSYLSVITIVPVLVFTALGVTASLTNTTIVQTIVAIEPFGSLYEFATKLVPYLLIIAAFTFLYVFIPNTRVRTGAALTGGVVAGVLWQTTGWIFTWLIADSASYAAIYSGFAILIILMIWIYWNWLILLVGADIAFYQQRGEYLASGRKGYQLSNRAQEELSLMIMALIGQHWYQQRPAWSANGLVEHLQVPVQAIKDTLRVLEQGGLLVRTTDTPSTWLPARPLEATTVKQVFEVVRNASQDVRLAPHRPPETHGIQQVTEEIDRAVDEALKGRTLRDLVMAETPAGSPVSRPKPGLIQRAP
jgi:membrane protein